jgi:hypothetical protein
MKLSVPGLEFHMGSLHVWALFQKFVRSAVVMLYFKDTWNLNKIVDTLIHVIKAVPHHTVKHAWQSVSVKGS